MAPDRTMESFAENLRQEVINSSEMDGAESFAEEAFTKIVRDYLVDAGEFADAEVCQLQDGGRQVHGYGFDEEQGVLDLLIAVHKNEVPAPTVERPVVVASFKKLTRFLSSTLEGYGPEEEASAAFDMCELIRSRKDEITRVRMYLLTDGLTTKSVEDLVAEPIGGLAVTFHIWDMERLFRCATSGQSRETIEIDFVAENGQPLPCLPMPNQNTDYKAFLAIIPGALLHRLYERYGDRLLERNVRSFLQARGKVNRGIRDTLLTAPHRFLAYNNGISATAAHVELVVGSDGGIAIKTLRDLQIVNGGQTTASISQAVSKDHADVSMVSVQAKISVVRPEDIDQIVPLISRYANSQNKISEPDFSANDIFHVTLEELSRTVWTPPTSGSQRLTRWFYERARGQYQVARTREGTPARQRSFVAIHPPQQKFTKTEIAKFENSWNQLPYLVSRGGEKNFREYTIQIRSNGHVIPDQPLFFALIAKAILFKKTERIVQDLALGGYRANVVTYSIAYLARLTGGKLDLDAIWKLQDISPSLVKLISTIARKVQAVLLAPPGGANITEWCKKEQCWRAVCEISVEIPPAVAAELADRKKVKLRPDADDDDCLLQKALPEGWGAIARWAKASGVLPVRDSNLLTTIAILVQKGRRPSARDLEKGKVILSRARELGFVGLTG